MLAFNPSTGEIEQVDLCEFKVGLVYKRLVPGQAPNYRKILSRKNKNKQKSKQKKTTREGVGCSVEPQERLTRGLTSFKQTQRKNGGLNSVMQRQPEFRNTLDMRHSIFPSLLLVSAQVT